MFKRFYIPEKYRSIPIEIIQEPYDVLLSLEKFLAFQQKKKPQLSSVVLPLYSYREKRVPEKSGLNQWNAGGRKRDLDEVYIPIPDSVHRKYPNFFPTRDMPFILHTPDGKILSAKVCQDGRKALMTNPNSALADWLLRRSLSVKQGELVTMDRLKLMSFDSVIVSKMSELEYKMEKAPFGAFQNFMESD